MTSEFSIRLLRDTGGRVFWSPEGKQLAFIEDGQAYILDMSTGGERCITCAYDNVGFERVQYLGDGSLLLIGAEDETEALIDENIDIVGRIGGTSLWWIPADASRAPQPLNQRVFEGVAMSPTSNTIAWTQSVLQLELFDPSSEFELWTGRVAVSADGAKIVDRQLVLKTFSIIEAQDILDGGARLLFSSYYDTGRRTVPYDNPDGEVMTVDVATGEITNHTNHPSYDEAEGIFHGTDIDVIESGRDTGNGFGGQLDLYALRLDGTGDDIRRLTNFAEDTPDLKANNPDVHPDGRSIAFSVALVTDDAGEATGTDAGIRLLEFSCAPGDGPAGGSSNNGNMTGSGGMSLLSLLLLAILGAARKLRSSGVAASRPASRRPSRNGRHSSLELSMVLLLALGLGACTGQDSGANNPLSDILPRANSDVTEECALGLPQGTRPYTGEISVDIPSGRTLLVIGQDPDQMHEYVDAVGEVPAGFMFYLELQAPLEKFVDRLAFFADFMSCYPGALINIGLTMGDSPIWSTVFGSPAPPGGLSVINGAYDAQIDALGDWMNTRGHLVHLRIGYEFDLLGGQWGPPTLYQQGYRHIVDRLRAKEVKNAVYIWHSAGAFFRAFDYSGPAGLIGSADSSGATGPVISGIVEVANLLSSASVETDFFPLQDFYPGEGYVDYFGISFWGDSCCFGESSAQAKDAYMMRTRQLLAEAQSMGLPIVIGESTPAYIGSNSGQKSRDWLNAYFDMIEEFDIRTTAHITQDWVRSSSAWGEPYWGGFWPDSRVQADPSVLELWKKMTHDDRFQ